MTPIDDLKPGDWIAILRDKETESQFSEASYLGTQGMQGFGSCITGEPYCILAIDLPFIGVTNGVSKTAFDTRDYEFKKLSNDYSSLMATFVSDFVWDPRTDKYVPYDPNHHPVDFRDPRDCVYCGERMRNRRTGSGKWRWICANADCRMCQEGVEIYLPDV